MFEIQKSGDTTSSGEIGLDIRTHASPKVGQDQVSGGSSKSILLTNISVVSCSFDYTAIAVSEKVGARKPS